VEPPRRLTPPPLRRGIVRRPRLGRLLDAGGDAQLTLLAAPAGYGKTVAAETWLAARGHQFVWIRADARDDDSVRLWSSIAVGVGGVRPGAGAGALERLNTHGGVVEPAIDALAAALAEERRAIVMVLDDLQSITDTGCLRSLDHAVAAFPANVQLVLLSRTVPPLRLARLRAHGQLVELGASELAFTAAEARELFAAVDGVSADATTVTSLTVHTEGWPAVLYLAALWVREHDDHHGAVQALRGSQRVVDEFLSDEVIGALGAGTRQFLERTSVLPNLCGDLCDAVLGQTGSADRLRELEQSNLLVIPVAYRPGWYRYHELLREHLLRSLHAPESNALRRRALAWSRDHGRIEDAAEYARAIGDAAALLTVIEDHALELIRGGRSRTLVRWCAAVPREDLYARPRALVAAITAAHVSGRPAVEIRRLLAVARGAELDVASSYELAMLRLVVALYTDDIPEAVSSAQAAVEISGTGGELLVPALAILALVQLVAGDDARAAGTAAAALEHPDAAWRPYGHVTATATLAILDARATRRHSARERADAAVAQAREAGLAGLPAGAPAQLADALTSALEGRLSRAQRAARRAATTAIAGGVWQAWSLLELARIELLRGRRLAAENAFEHARELIGEARDAGALAGLADRLHDELDAARASESQHPAEPLSPAELAVLRQLPERTVREIAETLFLSPNTIKSHIRSIYRKLGVNSREDAATRATALGLLGEPELEAGRRQ
jgi:LuxR family transcriptional regulator, maltose regulon positive regulatory protein